jgi:hypothetical protein
MKITTLDIIKVLPFEEEFKNNLLEGFDALTPDQKFNIEQIVWDAYGALYQIKLDKNTREALLKVEDGQEDLDKEFHKRIKEKTEKEMQEQFSQAETNVDLTEAREALQAIIKNPTGSN